MRGLARRETDERGAVAVFVAVLATVLLMMGALAVDLGNGWARKQAAQTQVDVSAISAGYLLSDSTVPSSQIVSKVAEYLNKANNDLQGQNAVTTGQLTNSDESDGEVVFSNGRLQMQVIAPPARVDFTFGRLVADWVDVQAAATVEVRSEVPSPADVLPFALPSGCPYGPGMADTGSGGGKPLTDADFKPNSGQTGSHEVTGISVASTTKGTASVPLQVGVTGLPAGSTGGIVRFHLGKSTSVDYPATWTAATSTDNSRTVTVTADTGVTSSVGSWRVWVLAGHPDRYSESTDEYPTPTFEVLEPAASPAPSPAVGCSTSVSGNFGQLDSPRADVNQRPARFAYNIAAGLDHVVVPFQSPSANVCATNAGLNPIAGAILDEEPSTDGRNCLNIDTGNDGPKVMQGLITGVDASTKGRLDRSFGVTRSGCGMDVEVNHVWINNDKLSCFLRNGATLTDLTKTTGVTTSMLDPAVTKSPRFVWIPVLNSPTRINDKWQPIQRFVPAMITGETAAGPGDADNGVKTSGNSVSSIQVFTFNPDALPIDERNPNIAYNPTVGRALTVLVD